MFSTEKPNSQPLDYRGANTYRPSTASQPSRPIRREYPEVVVDCKPRHLYSPWGILRLVELTSQILVTVLVTVTCDSNACTSIINEFGRVAQGEGYVVSAAIFAIVVTFVYLCLYSLNVHRAAPGCVYGSEKALYIFMIVILIPAAIIQCYMTAQAAYDMDIFQLGRGQYGIRPGWIGASVLSVLNVFIYIGDLAGQFTAAYPNQLTFV